jgi:hypothetical protein
MTPKRAAQRARQQPHRDYPCGQSDDCGDEYFLHQAAPNSARLI